MGEAPRGTQAARKNDREQLRHRGYSGPGTVAPFPVRPALRWEAMPSPRLLTADRGDAGLRLDLVLRRHLGDVDSATRTRVQAWIESGQVTVNGKSVRRVAARAARGDVITVTLPDEAPRTPMSGENLPIEVLYEDSHLLALNKEPGIVVHPTYRHAAGTLLNRLLWHARDWKETERPCLVNRLDKLTSGIVLVAKSPAIQTALQKTRMDKDYLAVVYGRVSVARGSIDLRLGRDRADRRRVVASTSVGAPSITTFERLSRVPAPAAGLSLLRCGLVTGRTHQIRVHLAARGWPIVGDPTYGEPRWREVTDAALAGRLRRFPRQALHAWRLAVSHPVTKAPLRFEAPVPQDLQELMDLSGFKFRFSVSGWG